MWGSNIKSLFASLLLALVLAAPAMTSAVVWADDGDVVVKKSADPFEGFNRRVYRFNSKLDRWVLKPITSRYVKHVPPKVRRGVKNVFSNLREPTTIVNDVLQGKGIQAAKDSFRFVLNSTFGILGVFDVATHLNLPRNKEDFGQTMGKWGVPAGPYLVLPLLGPSSVRDAAGLIPQYAYTDMTAGIEDETLKWSLFATRAVDARSGLLKSEKILQEQLDPYVFVREAYLQKRVNDVYDGNPPEEEDDLLNEILEQGD
ncbi:MAG: phospholipid-binding lipoprotein MlaA [Parasphingorhabdus sp.]|jgi:phospholipid-binding lipoprotein MlaA